MLVAAGLLIQGCAKQPMPLGNKGNPKPYSVFGKWYQPLPNARGYSQKGIASWYGKKFHGRKTANGEVYNMYAMTAAHKTLPLGTFVEVKNLDNGSSVNVRINDRGPFVRGRIIDLSYAAAKRISIVGSGTAKVKIKALGAPAAVSRKTGKAGGYVPIDYYSGKFTIQVGAFADRRNAKRLVRKLDGFYKNAHMNTCNDGAQVFYRVRVGRLFSLNEAITFEQTLIENGYPDTFIVAE
ncbi:MAG: septal ring lytic transglycosylase RlpA family protein [Desulfobacteraceae bacterium]|nr:septal ring lytic transglycosylase RlpA family protein [Desulfobacteraceae bacterium]